MQTEFVRSLNCNYVRVLLDKKPEEKRYQYCILNRGGIKGLLPCSLRYINGEAYLYYDISSKQNIKQLYEGRSITREWILDFMWSFRQIGQELGRFLLDGKNVLWYPEQIYQDLESNLFSFLYLPYHEESNGFKELLEFWVERMDYNDEALVECVYRMYEQYGQSGDVYLQSKFPEDAKILEETERLRIKETVEAEGVVGETDEKEEREMAGQEATVMPDKKRGIFRIFEGKKKRERVLRENYQSAMQEAMNGYAVAEDTEYGEEYGRTVYMEKSMEPLERERQLCTSDGKVLVTLDRPVTTIGKRKEEADLVLEDISVSRLHARIVKEKETYYIEDLNSTNGTFKNGLRLQPYERRELEEEDEIKTGRVIMVFR